MKAKKFKEVNTAIGFGQEEYQVIPANKETSTDFPGMDVLTMCFELDEDEKKQVAETGCIWLQRLQPKGSGFHPIGPYVLKPEKFQNVDEINKTDEFDPEKFDIKSFNLDEVGYFYKRAAVKHLGLKAEGKTEADYNSVLEKAQKEALKE